MHRLAESRIDNHEEAKIISKIEDKRRKGEGLDLEDEDAFEEWRRRIRERLLQRQQDEAALMLEEVEEEEEYENDSEEDTTGIAMLKLVFVPKSERHTIAEA
ncbi:Hypothetical predicted protein [Olea europaea subsp. europaea]|uniref:Uncharacterized protein n=1 Tax=Olea europaea subsp. europaea TaxID=158383 RepID=A0A8S0T1F1_OLEEU|nr:Hypothetical predicted protein [Olea europaea subsp. europaea]